MMPRTQRPAHRLEPIGTGKTLILGDDLNDSMGDVQSRPTPYAMRVRFTTRRDLERAADSLAARERRCHETNDPDGADRAAELWEIAATDLERRDAEAAGRERRKADRMRFASDARYAAEGEGR